MLCEQLGVPPVEKASNGQQAIDKCLKSKFDLIIMDLHMPILDGFGATSSIKATALHKDTIIVALSACSYNEQLIGRCKEAGFSQWLTSPVSVQQMSEDVL
mmetsp:Transcript_42182/g.64684  ORF Transcript_42182/g.64684 Transcript_42182/m.64684 type:complete len:101 (+) Transcript_42182:1110-1412(+)